jgi:eukaryotic-like serine/threonine-protein kinase
MPLSPGTILARYRIERALGSGGMGTVYLARHPSLPRSDALKVLSAELSQDPQFRARFIREADLAATLNHPNIVTVYDRGETEDGQLWIAMQYVEGSDANSELAQAEMTPARAAYIITEVAKALDYAHQRGVLHRDVKPANFLLSGPVGDQERVLLADFGIARALNEATRLTATGSFVTTIAYAAPETLHGGPVDQRADVYSLGCALFRLLTGRTPYGRLDAMSAIMAAHLFQPIPRATELKGSLPSAVDDVITRALAKDPAHRYPSAGALAAALNAALGSSAHATQQTRDWGTPAPPTVPPQPWPAAGGWPPPPPGHPGGPGPRPPAGVSPFAPAPMRPRRRRTRTAVLAVVAVLVVAATVTAVILTSRRGGDSPYREQTLVGALGTVHLTDRPRAVAALGPGDPDAVLSLGVQPVVMTAGRGKLPGWLQNLVHSGAPVLSAPDASAIAATRPDLVIDTGSLGQIDYNQLSSIAPTLTRPAHPTQDWAWQAQLKWIAAALGRDDTATRLLKDATARQTQTRAAHPAFAGKTIAAINVSDTGITADLADTSPGTYLSGLGFRYSDALKRGPAEAGDARPIPDLTALPTEVLVVIRTDKAAGGGSYNGLPSALTGYRGAVIIVDDADVIAALNTGGYAADGYLNSTFVNSLAQQVH